MEVKMRAVIISSVVVALLVASVSAQSLPGDTQQTQPAQQTPAQEPPAPAPKLNFNVPIQVEPPERRQFGIFTLEPPVTNGQIIGIGVPVGALIMQGITSLKDAQHRRSERKAQAQVKRELAEFLAQTAVARD